ncbi:hypothetical protein BSL78_19175 [Apostichopus japonicus]|uniref:Ig-like domain-containing protein n=1 Tax=Stichopus japonicus TaxID=307972 RepID=A0A2G8K7N0_STIJA|nr:hypothetical protein BSL78_19175 [Apostichopus japonicus]
MGVISCSCNGSSMALIAWVNVNKGKALLLLHNGERIGDGYESGEFDIYPNGSLLINNVTASHESVYRVSTAISISSFRISKNICVQTTVKPAITIPVIEECSNTYGTTCVKSITDSVEVNCFVRDSRPAVKLSWTIRTHGGDHISPSNYMNLQLIRNITSHVTATFSFGESSVLSLLVCRANSVPLNLVEEENDFLVEKEIDYTSLANPIRINLKIHSPMNLSCADLGFNIVVWKWSPQQDAFGTLYVSIFHKDNHTKISNKEYKLEDEGSLSLQNTLVEHEGLYACVYDNGVSGGIVLYDVLVMVYPTAVFLVIDGCNHQQYCVLEKQPQDVLTCSVLGIRPKVALEWRAFREETSIDFTTSITVTQMGDLYDISLTVNFDFTLTIQNKFTVECRAVGENAELFSLSTKVDLLFPNVLPTEQRSYTSTIIIIAVLATMIINITAAVVVVCRIKEKAERFIEHLKEKYDVFYDSVQPIPYITDRMYCVDKYLYRFACGLKNIAGEKIIQYLQQKKESEKFAILCMLEQEDKTDRFIKTVSELVSSEETYIRREDSKLLQRSTLLILDVASKNQIPISHLYLLWSFSGFDDKDIRLESGLSLSSLTSVEKISINKGRQNQEFTEEDMIGLLNYGIKSPKFKYLVLHNCELPSSIKPDIIPEEARSRNIKGPVHIFNIIHSFILKQNVSLYFSLCNKGWPDDIQTISEMCSDVLIIDRDTSESVHWSVIEFLVEASNHDII